MGRDAAGNEMVSLGSPSDGSNYPYFSLGTRIAGEDIGNDFIKTRSLSTYTNLTADTAVKSIAGILKGIFVASASNTPTIKIWDNTAGSGTVLVNTFTPVAATWYPFPDAEFSTGLYVDIGGTVDITVFWR